MREPRPVREGTRTRGDGTNHGWLRAQRPDEESMTKLKISHGFSEAELDEAVQAARNFVPAGTLRELLDRLKAKTVIG